MSLINFSYKESEKYTDDAIEVFANDANVGILSSQKNFPGHLMWHPDFEKTYCVRFQFRHEETFLSVVEELKRYKDEHGYKYLTIWAYNGGYASLLDMSLLEKAGFKTLQDMDPNCLFLE